MKTNAFIHGNTGLDVGTTTFWIPQPEGVLVADLNNEEGELSVGTLHIDDDFGGNLKDKRLKKVHVPQELIDELRGLLRFDNHVAKGLLAVARGRRKKRRA